MSIRSELDLMIRYSYSLCGLIHAGASVEKSMEVFI